MHTPTPLLAADFRQLLSDELASEVTAQAVEILSELFAPRSPRGRERDGGAY